MFLCVVVSRSVVLPSAQAAIFTALCAIAPILIEWLLLRLVTSPHGRSPFSKKPAKGLTRDRQVCFRGLRSRMDECRLVPQLGFGPPPPPCDALPHW